MIAFDKIVKKLLKRTQTLINSDDLADLLIPGVSSRTKSQQDKVHKLAYRLRALGILSPIRRGLWTITSPGTSAAVSSAEDLYWKMLVKTAQASCGNRWMIAGRKALELHLRDVSVPEDLRLLTDGAIGTTVISPGHTARFVPLRQYGAKGAKTLFGQFAAFGVRLSAEEVRIPVISIEHALLEYLNSPAHERDGHLLARALTKFGAILRRDVLGALVSLRYIVAVNRLKEAAKRLGFPAVYVLCLDIVKREGRGRFLSS